MICPFKPIVLFVTLSFSCAVRAQWVAASYVSYAIPKANLLSWDTRFLKVFDFPRSSGSQALVIDSRYPVSLTNRRGVLPERLNGNRVAREKARLVFTAYCENVDSIIIRLKDRNHGWMANSWPVSHDGYQVPIASYITGWPLMADPTSQEPMDVDSAILRYSARNPGRPSRLIFGQLEIVEQCSHEKGVSIPWLDSLTNNLPLHPDLVFDNYSSWAIRSMKDSDSRSVPLFQTFAIRQGYLPTWVEFQPSGEGGQEPLLLRKLLEKAMDLYPFYEDKKLDVDSIRAHLTKLFEKPNIDNPALFKRVRDAIAHEFHDPHFELYIPPTADTGKRMVDGPVRIRNFAGNFMVSAVFADRYKDTLPVGSYVCAIDGRSIDSLSTAEMEGSLKRGASDSVELTYRSPTDPLSIRRVTISYSVRTKIDSNFQPRHAEFRIFDHQVAYYRINHWTGDNVYNLVNHRAEIIRAGSLIIDLRGNGGGYGDEVLATLALFLEKPESIGRLSYPWFQESIVVVPEKRTFRFPQTLNLFVLVDGGTACGSEIFILGLKKRASTWSLGDSRTMGAIANPGEFRFPSGITLRMHTIIGRYYFDKTYYTEGKGIDPDFCIPRTNPRDLYPYQDKVLAEAVRISERARQ